MRNILIVIGVLNVLLIGGLWFGYQAMNDHRAEYEQLSLDIMKEEATQKNAATLLRTLETIQPARAKLDNFFYEHSDDDGVRFVEEIEGLARITGVNLMVSVANFSGTPPNTIFRMNAQVNGTWTQVNRFMRLLEVFPAHVLVTRWSFISAGGAKDLALNTPWGGVINFDLMSVKESAPYAGN